MRNITLRPENILRAGRDGTQQDILAQYLALYKKGYSNMIPPIFVVENDPTIIRETLESKERERLALQMKLPRRGRLIPMSTVEKIVYLSEFQQIDVVIGIPENPTSRIDYLGSPLLNRIMECFGYSGNWNDFLKRYNAGEFHPLYIHPDVLRFEGETDIVDVCTRDNTRLTYFGEVLTRQQYEQQQKSLHKEMERDITKKVEREFYRFQEIEKLAINYLDRGAQYLLVDGNHRAIAATITENPINSLVLTSDDDVQEAIGVVDSGRIRDFHWRWHNLNEVKISLYDFYAGNIDSVSTVRELSDKFLR